MPPAYVGGGAKTDSFGNCREGTVRNAYLTQKSMYRLRFVCVWQHQRPKTPQNPRKSVFFIMSPLTHDQMLHKVIFLLFSSGILKKENGVREDEENFEEAVKNVNTALNPTKVPM